MRNDATRPAARDPGPFGKVAGRAAGMSLNFSQARPAILRSTRYRLQEAVAHLLSEAPRTIFDRSRFLVPTFEFTICGIALSHLFV